MNIKGRTTEVIKATGGELCHTLKKVFDKANVVKVVIRKEDGREMFTIPGGYGSLALISLPRLSFLLLASFVVMKYEIIVYREENNIDERIV